MQLHSVAKPLKKYSKQASVDSLKASLNSTKPFRQHFSGRRGPLYGGASGFGGPSGGGTRAIGGRGLSGTGSPWLSGLGQQRQPVRTAAPRRRVQRPPGMTRLDLVTLRILT